MSESDDATGESGDDSAKSGDGSAKSGDGSPEFEDTTPKSLTTDQAFDLLGDATRRRAVVALCDMDKAMALDDLATAVVERAPEGASQDISEERRKRAAASLHHCHLPKLDDAGVVEYDSVRNWVEPTPLTDALDPFFEAAETGIEEFGRD